LNATSASMNEYVLSRWECLSGCGTFEHARLPGADPPRTTCTKCGRSARFVLAIRGITTLTLPFFSLPRTSEQQITGKRALQPRGGHQANGKSTGRPPKPRAGIKLPKPQEVRLPGDRKPRQKITAIEKRRRKQTLKGRRGL